MSWDPHAARRLEEIRTLLAVRGVLDLVRTGVAETWEGNRRRYDPQRLYDDVATLGYLSSRNLSNRVYASLLRDPLPGVGARREYAATVVLVEDLELRLVKTPADTGRRPNFTTDFDWHSSDSRLAAARRNAEVFTAPHREATMEALFEDERPGARAAAALCRDVFLVWGADLDTGATAGWLGLPTVQADRWLAVADLWWDPVEE